MTSIMKLFIFSTAMLRAILVCAFLDPLDFLVLQSLKKSLRDVPGSTFFSSWDFTSDPCNFPGVFCESDKVVQLNLGEPRAGSPGLTGRLDPSLANLSSLTVLSFVPGRIYGRIPDSIALCSNLTILAVPGNFLRGEIPFSLSKLRQLKTLDLSYNQLSGTIPWLLGEIPSLTNVVLSHNRISGSVPPFFTTNLSRLDLGHNRLSGELTMYSLPPSLQHLSLTSNRLTGPVNRVVSRLNRIKYLDLSMNRLTGPVPTDVFSFPAISSLILDRNRFSGLVRPMTQVEIQTVDLSYNRLYGRISPLLSTVQNLYLNNNRFMGPLPDNFVNRLLDGQIRVLYLQHNFLTRIHLNPSAEIPLSSSLCVQYNCLVPPVQTACPAKAGWVKTRPPDQCKTSWVWGMHAPLNHPYTIPKSTSQNSYRST